MHPPEVMVCQQLNAHVDFVKSPTVDCQFLLTFVSEHSPSTKPSLEWSEAS